MANFIATFWDNTKKLGELTKAKEEIQAKYDSTSKELTDVKTELESVKQQLSAQQLSMQQWNIDRDQLISSHDKDIEELTNGFHKQIEDLNKAVEEAKNSAGKVASSIVASAGLEPETVKVSTEEITGIKGAKSRFKITSTIRN
jgi:SMC interacting uncharacterized protein involved in chromosome segregation